MLLCVLIYYLSALVVRRLLFRFAPFVELFARCWLLRKLYLHRALF